jgi:capsid assembly protease
MPSFDDFCWGIYPLRERDTLSRLTAYAKHCAEKGIDDVQAVSGQRDGLPISVDGGVAVVSLMGTMLRRAGPVAKFFGFTGTESVRAAIDAANADPDVERILLRVDSPGGSVSGLDQLGESVAMSSKPVTAVVDGMAASAAYYVASQAKRVVAGRNDMVGSIGTRLMLYDYSKMFAKEGIEAVPIDTGEFKSAGAFGTKITEAQRADFQRLVDFYYADFLSTVARGRGMREEDVRKVADGRLFPPSEAMTSRLIDGVSTLERTLTEMRAAKSTDSRRARLQF